MGDVAKEGRTVLFVSHNMAAVLDICRKGILLANGQAVMAGDIAAVVREYSNRMQIAFASGNLDFVTTRSGKGGARLHSCTLYSKNQGPLSAVRFGEPLEIRVSFSTTEVSDLSYLAVQIYRYDGSPCFSLYSSEGGMCFDKDGQEYSWQVTVPSLPLFPSLYMIKLGLCNQFDVLYDFVDPAMVFEVLPRDGMHRSLSDPRSGMVHIDVVWATCDAIHQSS